MKFIDSKDNYWDKGMNLGIALVVISLLVPIKNPWVTFSFDWITVFFAGLSIFFFFMAIRLNTEIMENVDINGPNQDGVTNRRTLTNYQTHLTRFNILSKSSFTISVILEVIVALRLIGLLIIYLTS